VLSKQERLRECFRRMASADPSSSFDEAYRLLCTTIDQVEDEHSGQPNEPERWKELDRIFPPKMDRMSSIEGTDVKRFDTVRHLTYIAPNGAIEIRRTRLVAGKVVVQFSKSGGDGRSVCDVCPQLSDKNL
jgi:hypothetical protein